LQPFAADFLVDFMKDIGHERLPIPKLAPAGGKTRRNLAMWRRQGKDYGDKR
jgi:hypothetical protein